MYDMLAQGHSALNSSWGWRGWVWAVVVAALIVATVMVFLALLRRQRQRCQRTCRLEISNLGNVRSRYELRAQDLSGVLLFTFALDGTSLQEAGGGEVVTTQPARPTAPPAAKPAPATPKAGLKKTKSWAMGAGNIVAEVLNSVGMLLPRSAGAPLMRTAASIRRGERSVRRVERLPKQAARLQARGKGLGTSQRVGESASQRIGELGGEERGAPTAAGDGWVQTPFVEPGETLAIDLLVDPANPYQTQDYSFKVISRSLEQPEPPLIVEESNIQIVGLTPFQRYSPFLIVLLVAVMLLSIASWLIGTGP